jgi:FtsK/SpoIIIE family
MSTQRRQQQQQQQRDPKQAIFEETANFVLRETLATPEEQLEDAREEYSRGIKGIIQGVLIGIADLVGAIAFTFLVVGAWHQAISALAAWFQVLLWLAALGLAVYVGYRAVTIIAEGYITFTHATEILKDRRARRERQNQLTQASVTVLESAADVNYAEAQRIRAEAEQKAFAFPMSDDQGNALVRDPYSGQFALLQGNMRSGITSYHHSEHVAPGVKAITEQQAGALPATMRELPNIEQFYALIPRNSLQTAMGIEAATGKPIIVPIRKSTHFKLIGGSGMGKSCLSAGMIDVAAATNDPDHLKLGLLDLEHNTSRLFEDLPHIAEIGPRRQRLIGRDPDEVAQKLKLLQWELSRRAGLGEEYCTLHEPVLLVYVEEMLALKYEVVDEKLKREMLAAINILGVRARKYGIFLLACMQTDYSDKSTREAMAQFRTRAGFAIDPEVARASGFFNVELVKQNFQAGSSGQYVLEKPQYSGLVLAPNYDVATRLEQLKAPTTPPTERENIRLLSTARAEDVGAGVGADVGENQPPLPAPLPGASQAALERFTAQEQRIIRKFTQEDMGIGQIVASEFTNTKGEPLTDGNLYRQRSKEVQDILRRAFNQEAS